MLLVVVLLAFLVLSRSPYAPARTPPSAGQRQPPGGWQVSIPGFFASGGGPGGGFSIMLPGGGAFPAPAIPDSSNTIVPDGPYTLGDATGDPWADPTNNGILLPPTDPTVDLIDPVTMLGGFA